MEVSRLAQFVREFRDRNKWSQQDLEEQLGIKRVQYVHKLEKGKLRKPSPEFLRKFALLSQRSIDELQSMIDVDALPAEDLPASKPPATAEARDPDKYHVVFGHTIWAAPLALAALRGELD